MVPEQVPVMEGESTKGVGSPELRVGDLAITTHVSAGEPRLGDGVVVEVLDTEIPTCFKVRKFPLGDTNHFVCAEWMKLWWRPDADEV